jgi:hypothetical protein
VKSRAGECALRTTGGVHPRRSHNIDYPQWAFVVSAAGCTRPAGVLARIDPRAGHWHGSAAGGVHRWKRRALTAEAEVVCGFRSSCTGRGCALYRGVP